MAMSKEQRSVDDGGFVSTTGNDLLLAVSFPQFFIDYFKIGRCL